MQVILLERIRKLGQMGEVVNVKNGFARNYLLPLNKALRATNENIARFDREKAQLEARDLALKEEAEKIREKLNGQSFVLLRQAGESGQLYGSASARDIAAAVSEGGVSVSRGQIALDMPIKEIGLHAVEVVLHGDVLAQVTINVARSPDEAERQARGENVLIERTDQEEALLAAEEVFENPQQAEDEAAEAPTDAEDQSPQS